MYVWRNLEAHLCMEELGRPVFMEEPGSNAYTNVWGSL